MKIAEMIEKLTQAACTEVIKIRNEVVVVGATSRAEESSKP